MIYDELWIICVQAERCGSSFVVSGSKILRLRSYFLQSIFSKKKSFLSNLTLNQSNTEKKNTIEPRSGLLPDQLLCWRFGTSSGCFFIKDRLWVDLKRSDRGSGFFFLTTGSWVSDFEVFFYQRVDQALFFSQVGSTTLYAYIQFSAATVASLYTKLRLEIM